jgi:L-asparaginase II
VTRSRDAMRRISTPPVRVTLSRGRAVESVHTVHAVLINADGAVEQSWGDPDFSTVARSTLKPLAALPLIQSGAADALRLRDEWIALACASHGGTPMHLEQLRQWLSVLGCREEHLLCGPRAPLDARANAALARADVQPTRLHNDCSGEHLGFLSTALALGEPLTGYALAEHPVQHRVTTVVASLAGMDISTLEPLPDGCGAPTFAMPLRSLALAAARFVQAEYGDGGVPSAARRIWTCCVNHQIIFGGPGRLDGIALSAFDHDEPALIKTGAEGVVIAGWASGAAVPFGLAAKVEDGDGSARDAAAAALLLALAGVPSEKREPLETLASQSLYDSLGCETGRLEVDIP